MVGRDPLTYSSQAVVLRSPDLLLCELGPWVAGDDWSFSGGQHLPGRQYQSLSVGLKTPENKVARKRRKQLKTLQFLHGLVTMEMVSMRLSNLKLLHHHCRIE